MRLEKVEKEIFKVKKEIFDLPSKLHRPTAQVFLDAEIEKAKKPLDHQLDLLETERNFLLSKREAWLPKTIWNIVIPIVVSIFISFVTIKLNLK